MVIDSSLDVEKNSNSLFNFKKVICTIHHIDENKFDDQEKDNFYLRDNFVDEYHTISLKTFNQLKKLTNKNINVIPFWVNQNIWFEIENKQKLFQESLIYKRQILYWFFSKGYRRK